MSLVERVPGYQYVRGGLGDLTASDAAKGLIIVGAIAIGGYAVYKVFNPGVPGGSCTTPGSPCAEALAPYQQQYQQCADQYQQLMSTILNSGQAPTAAQQADLASLTTCMNNAAANIASTAQQFVPQNAVTTLLDDIGIAVIVSAVSYYGLKGLGSFIKQWRSSSTSGSGSSMIMYAANLQYAITNGLITSEVASAWQSSVSSLEDANLSASQAFWSTLATEQVVSESIAQSELSFEQAAFSADAAALASELSAFAGYAGYSAPTPCGRCY